ncbi:MAG: HEXXH motif-containing putative peptide modification protein [Deltaproteobacteria bacterium]|nr:HEXXH motif-containing putative peptide modification protein [Deltaproteobacteria bacterium]
MTALDRLDAGLLGLADPCGGWDGGNEYRGLLRALPGVLGWRRREARFLGQANASHSAFIGDRIAVLGGRTLHARLCGMPPRVRSRVKLAPEVFRVVFLAGEEESGHGIRDPLERFCAVEERIHGDAAVEVPADEDGWSALGDVRIGGPGGAGRSALPAPCRQVGALTLAPVVRAMVIDGYSPHHATLYRYPRLPVQSHRPAEFRAGVARLSSALEFIASVSEPACAMVDACLRVVALVRMPKHPEMTMSGSHPELCGLAGLTNLHSSRWTAVRVANALVHEAIHALVAKIELAEGLFSSYREAQDITAVSPWSGRRLPLRTYVHGCLVWFGLWQFWRRAGAHGAGVAELAEKSRSGFAGGSCLRSIPPEGMAVLEPDAADVLREMVGAADRLSG